MKEIRADIKILIGTQDIIARVKGLAQEITESMPADMMIISILRGSFIFTADLIRALHFCGARPQVDFITLASYGSNTTSSGKIEVTRDIGEDVKGRDILLLDDILESGNTLSFARDTLLKRGAKSVKIVVMLEKPGKRKVEIDADFVGFEIPDKFVVGYGLDYANYYRELPYIGVIKNEEIK